ASASPAFMCPLLLSSRSIVLMPLNDVIISGNAGHLSGRLSLSLCPPRRGILTPVPSGVHDSPCGPLPAPRPRRVRGCRHQRAHGEGVRCLTNGLSVPTHHIATAPFAVHWRIRHGERTRHRHLPRNGLEPCKGVVRERISTTAV